jgi:transporter family-2 protein
MLGGVVVARAPLNSRLGRAVGGLQASVVALAISFLAILALSALIGGLGGLRRIGDAPLHVVIGGAWPARRTSAASSGPCALAAGGLTALTIAGRLGVAVLIDHFAWLGVERSPITVVKIAGVALLALGTWLVICD